MSMMTPPPVGGFTTTYASAAALGGYYPGCVVAEEATGSNKPSGRKFMLIKYNAGAGSVAAAAYKPAGLYKSGDDYEFTCDESDAASGGPVVALVSAPGDGEYAWALVEGPLSSTYKLATDDTVTAGGNITWLADGVATLLTTDVGGVANDAEEIGRVFGTATAADAGSDPYYLTAGIIRNGIH